MEEKQLIPKVKSGFLKVKCPECGNEQVVFTKSDAAVHCHICSVLLAEPTGGRAAIKGIITTPLE